MAMHRYDSPTLIRRTELAGTHFVHRGALMKVLLAVVFIVGAQQAYAQQKPPALSDLEKIERYQRAVDASNKLEALVDEQSRLRNIACMKSFGHVAMCKCLSDNLPFAFSFSDYVAITTQSKERNGYAKLNKDLQKAYNNVGPVRDKCVRESIK